MITDKKIKVLFLLFFCVEPDEEPLVFDVGADAGSVPLEYVAVFLQHVVDCRLRHVREKRAHVRHYVVQARAVRMHLGRIWVLLINESRLQCPSYSLFNIK